MRGATNRVLRYGMFAALSTLLNLGVQTLTLAIFKPATYALPLAMGGGTAAGFALKYILDKHWIFYVRTQSARREARQIIVYGLFSVATTALFWLTESLFTWIWHVRTATLTGAALGLVVGYTSKYMLDKRFTFEASQPRRSTATGD
jgi:putative flippase GtrA